MNRKFFLWGLLTLVVVFAILLTYALMHTPLPKFPANTVSVPTPTPQHVLGIAHKTTGCTSVGSLPDSDCTPGAIDPRVTQNNIQQTICIAGYSSTVRPPTSITNKIKDQEMLAYGDTGTKADYELDHLVSLELGGCPDCVTNLWPEPWTGNLNAHNKDRVENYLHKQVCSNAMTLSEAQEKIAKDWVSVYHSLP